MVNDDVLECPSYKDTKLANVFYDTKLTYNYCVPQADEAKDIVLEMYKELDENIGGFGNYINDIKDAWFVMVVMVVVSFFLTTFYVWQASPDYHQAIAIHLTCSYFSYGMWYWILRLYRNLGYGK